MTTHDDYMTRLQARDLARRLARLERKQRSTAAAHADLRHSAIDGGKGLVLKDEQGQEKYRLGTDENGVTAPQYKGGPVPAQPSEPFVDVGGEVVKIQHSGLDVDENPAPADFRRAQIHVAQDEVFEPSLSSLAGYLEEADGSFTHRLPGGEWWVGIVWETLSGRQSVMSATVLADIPPLVDAQDIQDTLDTAQEALDEYRDNVAAPRFQALEDGLSENSDNLADARTRLSEAEQTLSPLPGRIESAERDVEAAKEAAESAEARAVEASNNASNRLTNGGFELGLEHWDTTNVTLSNDAHTGNQAALIGDGGSLSPDASIPVSEGDVWDVSAYAKNGTELVIEVLDAATSGALETFTTPTAATWSETGRLRVEVPANVSYMNIRITGDNVLVDDVVLRDVTDVVRLERAATAARQTAEQAIAELAILQLAVDGEGGLRDQLQDARDTLATKADTSRINELDSKLSQLGWDVTKVWRQATPPPTGTTYEWTNGAHASASVQRVDGVEVARNEAPNPSFEDHATRDLIFGSRVTALGRTLLETRVKHGDMSTIISWDSGATHIQTIAQTEVNVQPGQWVALSIWVTSNNGAVFADGVITERTSSNQHLTHHYQGNYRSVGQNSMTRLTYVVQMTYANVDRVRAGLRFSGTAGTYSQPSGYAYIDAMHVAVANTQQAALEQIEEYFDGDSPDDREHDIWINADGVPHFWLKGWGWAVLDDARIDQLQNQLGTIGERLDTAESDLETALEGPIDHARLRVGEGAFDEAFASKLIADHATIINAAMRNLSVEEKILFAEAIGEQLWAELGVFDRLQAREGWIGGTLLEDGAVTAEKIHATREMITKIMGAEWAYIAQQLIVDGSILTRDLEALSAAIQSLTVTQRADIAELWAEELWTALAVIEELQAEEAWITSAMIEELTAEKVTVTENFVGRVAELLHLVVDRIDVNSLWADQTWQAAGHFGSELADQSTLVDGTGLRITKHDHQNETSTDIVRLGGEGIGLVFSDEDGNITGSQSPEGDASYRDVSVDRLTIGGRLLLPETDPAEFWDGNLWDSQPKGLVCFHEEDMAGVSVNHLEYGFIEVSHHVKANRKYRVTTNNFLMDNSQAHYGRFRYTIGDNPPAPHTESPQLGNTWLINTSTTGNVQVKGDYTFTPERDGLMRILLCVSRIGSTPGLSFNTIESFSKVQLRLEDLGPSRPYTGMARNAGHGGAGTVRDPRPLVGGITTAWDMTWFQNYSHGGTQPRSHSGGPGGYGANGLTQGMRQDSARTDGIWSSLFGFGTSTESTNPDDLGVSLASALNGADLLSLYLEVTNHLAWQSNGNTRYVFWHHNHTTGPNQYSAQPDSLGDHILRLGNRARIPLPLDQLADRAANGQLTGFGVANDASTAHIYAGQLSWANRPRLIAVYQR